MTSIGRLSARVSNLPPFSPLESAALSFLFLVSYRYFAIKEDTSVDAEKKISGSSDGFINEDFIRLSA